MVEPPSLLALLVAALVLLGVLARYTPAVPLLLVVVLVVGTPSSLSYTNSYQTCLMRVLLFGNHLNTVARLS